MTEQEIQDICKIYNIKNYTINPDGSIDVNGNVYLSDKGLTKLPLKFNRVSGSFYCYKNELISLVGSPNYIVGSFYCFENKLNSLDGFNVSYDKLYCDNKKNLIKKHKRSIKLKILETI